MQDNTKKKLIEAGWFEGRNIEIDEIIEKYKEREFELSIQNIIFLKEYGLLQFEFKNKNPMFNDIVYKHFNPIKTLGKNLYKKSLEYLEDEYDIEGIEKAIPIGETDNGNMIILCIENNVFYGYTDGCLVKYGNTVEDMLECLIGENCIPEYID